MRLLRSPREILFRLRQEIVNLRLAASPPAATRDPIPSRLSTLPDPSAVAARLQQTAFADSIHELADEIRCHRFPLLGVTIDAGPDIRWRRDYLRGIETERRYFRFIPYLDAARAGDHKIVWELNRHQHLVLLAQSRLLAEDPAIVREIVAQLKSWIDDNPFQRSINWASALEVAFRALSWTWIYHFIAADMPRDFRDRFLHVLYLHGRHIENNLSIYFSPNTHLLGEAVALHALGVLFPQFPRAKRWRDIGAGTVQNELRRQAHGDGSHFEQSTYYHVYALDMFLFHALLAPPAPEYMARVERMAEYLDSLLGPARSLPFLGDDDAGRFFHPFGPRDQFGRATLATCSVLFNRPEWLVDERDLWPQAAWWIGPDCLDRAPAPSRKFCGARLFADAGVLSVSAHGAHVLMDAGPFGAYRAGHSHADTLSIVVRSGDEEILVDAGSYTYVDEHWRNWFRSVAAHNTVRVDRRDQAEAAGPFAWRDRPSVTVRSWRNDHATTFMDAKCAYHGLTHRRRLLFVKPYILLITDSVEGSLREQLAEQFWHAGVPVLRLGPNAFRIGARAVLLTEAEADLTVGGEHGWRSPVFGLKTEAPVVRVHRVIDTPAQLGAGLLVDGEGELEIIEGGSAFRITRGGEAHLYEMPH